MKLFSWREGVLEVASASRKPCGARGGRCAITLALPSCCQIPPGVGVLRKSLEMVRRCLGGDEAQAGAAGKDWGRPSP